jgi:hypothetical protein
VWSSVHGFDGRFREVTPPERKLWIGHRPPDALAGGIDDALDPDLPLGRRGDDGGSILLVIQRAHGSSPSSR